MKCIWTCFCRFSFPAVPPASVRKAVPCNCSHCCAYSCSWRTLLRAKPVPIKTKSHQLWRIPQFYCLYQQKHSKAVQQRPFQAPDTPSPCRGRRLAQQEPTLHSASSNSCSPSSVTSESLACLLFTNSNVVINTIDWLWELNRKDWVFWSWNINPVHICHRSVSYAFKHCLVSQPKAFCKCNLSHGGKAQKA